MYSKLENIYLNNKFCSFYCDNDFESFYYGKIIAINNTEIAIQMVSPNGFLDGIVTLLISKIFKVEIDGMYDKKMRKLFNFSQIPVILQNINDKNIFQSILDYLILNNQIASIELMDSCNNDVVGFLDEINDNTCKVKQIDEYGFFDGYSIFYINDITKIIFGSIFENNLLTLYNKNEV